MLKRILGIASAILGAVLLIWLSVFLNIPHIHQLHHQVYLNSIQSIDKHFAQMQAELLRSRFGEVRHYDYVQQNYIDLQRHIKALSVMPAYVDAKSKANLEKLITQLNQQAQGLEIVLSDFQRANSLLRNSVVYLPTFIVTLKSLAASDATRSQLDLIEKRALAYYIYQDDVNAKDMQTLTEAYMRSENRPHEGSTLPVHVDVLLIYTKQVAEAMKKVGSNNLPSLVEDMHLEYETQFNAVNKYRESMLFWSEMLLLVFVIALLVVFAYAVVRSQKQLQEIFSVAVTAWGRGDFAFRMPMRNDDSDFIAQALNGLFVGIESAHKDVQKVTNALANGDFSHRIHQSYSGDLEILKQGVNDSADSVAFMMSELAKVMEGLQKGQLDVRMNERVPASFRKQVDIAMSNMRQVLMDINAVMDAFNQGDFSQRVQTEALGELADMKKAVNHAAETLDLLTSELLDMALAQQQGDLVTQARGEYRGRLQSLQHARAESTGKIRDVIALSINAANVVDQASLQVSHSAHDLSARVQKQASALEETSATMHEMASAVTANTHNARQVSDLAKQVQQRASEGVGVMQQTISAMQSIQQSSHQISDIVTLIDGIAFQTNLLALNAAVEAARAGDHGRGFAVVAGEVRALAQKSANAAKDIKSLIEDSVSRISVGTQLADKSGHMLTNITQSIEQVASMIEQIADASVEQSQGINQVHKAIAEIDKVTQENSALVEQTTNAAESLSAEANQLNQNMAFFKIK
jgi:methyl-accepting chemotaxis protein